MADIISKYQKFIDLEPIKDSAYKTQKNLIKSSSIIRSPIKRMDVENYFKERNDIKIQEELKEMQI